VKLALCGASGKMGRAVVRLASQEPDVRLVGAVDAPGSAALGRDVGELGGVDPAGVAISDDLAAALLGADVVIDFSTPASLGALLRAASRARVAVVSGTTGLGDELRAELERASTRIPVLWAPNMSLGVQLLRSLVEQAVRTLGPGYDVEIVETHHGAKVDAPSGTALELAQAAQAARPELELVHGRQGRTGPRPGAQLGMHSLRGGGVVGEHSVHLLGALERIELTHRAQSRDLFAAGALRAARYLVGKPAGSYRLADLITA
jgi:4-hydroxy-tetrahydrodipicolinate reductase